MLRRTLIPLAAVTALALPTAASARPIAHASKGCGYSRSLGFTYVNKIKSKGASCKKAKSVIKSYGNSGKKSGSFGGFKCSQKTINTSPVQYDANGTCKNGSKKITFLITQNT